MIRMFLWEITHYFEIMWWDNGQTNLSNRILRQLKVNIGRIEFGWHNPFKLYWYWHDEFATPCCGGMGTDCQHEEIAYEMSRGIDRSKSVKDWA